MENFWHLFSNHAAATNGGGGTRGQAGGHSISTTSNSPSHAWMSSSALWELGSSNTNSTSNNTNSVASSSSRIAEWNNNSFIINHHQGTIINFSSATTPHHPRPEEGAVHALMFPHHQQSSSPPPFSSSLYTHNTNGSGGSPYYHPDPHLMFLNLGNRHYFENYNNIDINNNNNANNNHQETTTSTAGFSSMTKKGKPHYEVGVGGSLVGPPSSSAATPTAPRCQVEGCDVVLVNAKEYHKRHKVCEAHSKAPKVVVLGVEQRFCQQCSRFHAISEFDESKRSCRRRLAGHNERRRKSSHHHHHHHHQDHSSAPRNLPPQDNNHLMAGSALSLLSSTKPDSWMSASPDLSARCSAALRELIVENRAAAVLTRQHNILVDGNRHWRRQNHHHHPVAEDDLQNPSNCFGNCPPQQMGVTTENDSWGENNVNNAGAHLTLNLKQAAAPPSCFSVQQQGKSSKEEHQCPELWGALGGSRLP